MYLGDVSRGARLDWNLFLGMRHIVEQVPFQKLKGTFSNTISSSPSIPVSVNINPTIDAAMRIDLVEKHEQFWSGLRSRGGMAPITRANLDEVVSALADGTNSDKLIYFYCHATTAGPNEDPDNAAIIMGNVDPPTGVATLGYLSTTASAPLPARPLIVLNACDSANLSPLFYDGFVPYFLNKGARGVIGTEAQTPVLFAIRWAEEFFELLLQGRSVGQTMLTLRQQFMRENNNPLGLLYATYCDADTRIAPPLARTEP